MFNVKRFAARGVAIDGIRDGVNVLCAANEAGKSTSFEALHALFFLPHSSTAGDIRALRPYSGGSPLVQIDVATGNGRYRITKQFYGGRFAQVAEQDTGRILVQADEAENFITELVRGGAGGPAGLLWVRQGVTGLEKRSRGEEEHEKKIRANLLESVQGEVEAVTGGRRMAEIMAEVSDSCAALITPTGRPKTGGRYAATIDERDRLAEKEQQLSGEVAALRDALDQRRVVRQRLNELDNIEDRAARARKTKAAQIAFEAAREQDRKLKTAQAELALARERRDTAALEQNRFLGAQERAHTLGKQIQSATHRRDEAGRQRHSIAETMNKLRADEDAALAKESAARDLMARHEAAAKAREVVGRLEELKNRLHQAETARQRIEENKARCTQLAIPACAIEELVALEVQIAEIRARRDARRPSVTVAYKDGTAGRIVMDGKPLVDGEKRNYSEHADLFVTGIGTIVLRSNRAEEDSGRLEQAEEKRQTLLASMGVDDVASAREQQEQVQQLEADSREDGARLGVLAPDGLTKLREEIAALAQWKSTPPELESDPAEVRYALDAAAQHRAQIAQELRGLEPRRGAAENSFVEAETEIAKFGARLEQATMVLGPEEGREQRAGQLEDRLLALNALLEKAQVEEGMLLENAVDLESARAAFERAQSVEEAVDTKLGQLRQELAGLDAQIRTRSEDAVEEKWQEVRDALAVANNRAAAFEREVAVLKRLANALDTARTQARDLYLRPVMAELKPLLGMLFDDVSVTFDADNLLPQSISRAGLEEEIDRLSGGMREQLSVLTRLAFARLLAREGSPTPVILDDALVYSDDDRIEKMFNALHRQISGQQIIVFSCRQRAFQNLGGNILRLTEWVP